MTRDSGTPSRRSSREVSLAGSTPDGSTSHGQDAVGPRVAIRGDATATSLQRNTGSLISS